MDALFTYSSLERRKQEWVKEQGIIVHEDWLPFYFAYADLFYGLKFQPITLSWRKLQTITDLFELCFQLSLLLWLFENNQTLEPRELGEKLFGIPRAFSTMDLKLTYGQRCSDSLARQVVFRPLALPLQYYGEEECKLLVERYGFDEPNAIVAAYLREERRSYNYYSKNYKLLRQPPSRNAGEGTNHHFLRYALRELQRSVPTFKVRPRTTLLTLQEYTMWEDEWRAWLIFQLQRITFCHESVAKYMGFYFGEINNPCRAGGLAVSPIAWKLLNLYTLLPPLPASVIVSRGLTDLKFQRLPLEEIITEEGFMSTSMVGLDPKMMGSKTYLHLVLPAKTPVIALLAHLPFQHELLLPPGTRYILYRRWEEDGLVKYDGEVIL